MKRVGELYSIEVSPTPQLIHRRNGWATSAVLQAEGHDIQYRMDGVVDTTVSFTLHDGDRLECNQRGDCSEKLVVWTKHGTAKLLIQEYRID